MTRNLVALLTLFCLLASPTWAGQPLWLIDIKGPIGPATADHLVRGLDKAQEAQALAVVLKIDTPGGLDIAMRQMIKAILAANIPVVGYVTPSGARAASAGTYLLYACHVAAMTPATNLGAATPVQIGTPSLPTMPGDKDREQDSPKPTIEPATAMERKVINDAVAYIQGLAQLRGRNEQWASKAVREGVSIPAEKALEINVIDILAIDMDDLLSQLDGRTVKVANKEITLNTQGIDLYSHDVDWRSEFLSVITNPNIAYILMLVGIYGLIFEFSNPGFGLPGILGALSILLALYAFQVLPISYAGLALILLGAALMVAEAFAPSFGILGLGGLVAFVIGSIMLMDTELPGYKIAMPIILSFAVFSATILVFALGLVIKARNRIVVTGKESIVGAQAVVEAIRENTPLIRLQGELWQVTCDQPLSINDKVVVTSADNIVLQVSPRSQTSTDPNQENGDSA